jgi:glycosyltransferase involved in cell wall biosynthesis
MASGLPVVAPDRGATREVVHAHQGGLVVPDTDDALVEALDALLRDPARRRALGDAGRRSVAASGTAEVAARAWLARLQGVVKARGAA